MSNMAALPRVSAALRGYRDRGQNPAIVVLIHRNDEPVFAEALGARRDALFRLASMTKPVIAAAALGLVEEGLIRLHDPVDPWLPELAARVVLRTPDAPLDDVAPATRPITLHHLLTSRPGIGWAPSATLGARVFGLTTAPVAAALGLAQGSSLGPDSALGPDEWLAALGELPLLSEPGDAYHYHTAYDILGVLIARVTGKPLETALRERIFEPLAMVDTGFHVPEEKLDRLTVLYAPSGSAGLNVRDDPADSGWATPPRFPSGGAGLVSTADDFQQFARMLLGGGKLNGVRVLSRRTVEAMTTDKLTPAQHAEPYPAPIRADADGSNMWANQGYGYGVAVRTRQTGIGPSVGSFFWPGAFGTTWIADPGEQLAATLLTQVAGPEPFHPPLTEDFQTLTYQALDDAAPDRRHF
jgi:CubicO group peptidase (beta-lactamase class C family)